LTSERIRNSRSIRVNGLGRTANSLRSLQQGQGFRRVAGDQDLMAEILMLRVASTAGIM
jgi:hypothetical protein